MELNWHQFAANNNNKETFAFEQLCYQLFCSEHNQKVGIFRFKNQPGLETEPIVINGDKIGFQSKFYTTVITQNKGDIIDSIEKAKKKDSDLKTIYFYLNKEFGFSPKDGQKDPAYKTEIEEAAKKLDITLVWRVQSHLEIQLSLPENRYIYDKYFTQNGGVSKLIDGLVDHTMNLLFPIQTEIPFKGSSLKVDRSADIQRLEENIASNKTTIISGVGGSGKTALLKDHQNTLDQNIPFYLFKGSELDVNSANELFQDFGSFTLNDFENFHKDIEKKIFVIDSAERISDLNNQEPIIELIGSLIQNNWVLIFTTRHNYYDSLIFQFIEIFRIKFEPIHIQILDEDKLSALSEEYDFELPTNIRLKEFIRIPFSLKEYLSIYDENDQDIDLVKFKDKLWAKNIKNIAFTQDNVHVQRENAFLDIIKARSQNQGFYISSEYPDNIISLLVKDEVLGYNEAHGGYFITHDVYEEWGLNILIRRNYLNKESNLEFLNSIGDSLLIRRALREWLSFEIDENLEGVVEFIKAILLDTSIDTFWKDELLISTLLSENSNEVVQEIEPFLLENDFEFLKRALFLLRIGCKQVDVNLYNILIKKDESNAKYMFTKPKGTGWATIIAILFKHQKIINISNNSSILPILKDWNSYNREGETTRQASLLTLNNYVNIFKESDVPVYTNLDDDYFDVIVQGALTIKDELGEILNEIVDNNYVWINQPYYDFSEYLLKLNHIGYDLIRSHSTLLMKILEINWFKTVPKGEFRSSSIGLEEHYGLFTHISDYNPASAYQTPIYWLLSSYNRDAYDFTIKIINRSINSYYNSQYDPSVRKLTLTFEDGSTKDQIISHGLWQAFRGTGGPVVPDLIQSLHMALEKSLLELSRQISAELFEKFLLKLIKDSDSSSVTAVITSVVLANPDKLFNLEKLFLVNFEVLIYDKSRWSRDLISTKGLYSIGYGLIPKNKFYQEERIETLSQEHRREYLEQTILKYQVAPNSELTKEFIDNRKKEIWSIIDAHYSTLPEPSKQTERDKVLRLLLTRIDARRMQGKIIKEEEGLAYVELIPDVDPDLKSYSEESLKEGKDAMMYSDLKIWSDYRLNKKGDFKKYEDLEKDPKLALTKTKEIVDHLTSGADGQFILFNSSIPAFCCAVILRDFTDKLEKEDIQFCYDIILDYVNLIFNPDYNYQISDGVIESIRSIPQLILEFPEKENDLLYLLFKILILDYQILHRENPPSRTIAEIKETFWANKPELVTKIISALLLFKPRYDEILESESEGKRTGWFRTDYKSVKNKSIIRFDKKYKAEVFNLFDQQKDLPKLDFSTYSTKDLLVAFQFVPKNSNSETHFDFVLNIVPLISSTLLKDDRESTRDYYERNIFNESLVEFVLFRENNKEIDQIMELLKPNLVSSNESCGLINQFIISEDRCHRYEQFWTVWNSLYDRIMNIVKKRGYYNDSLISSYLFTNVDWYDEFKSWKSLKIENKRFFDRIIDDIGYHHQVFQSITKLLNSIGSIYSDEGVYWLSKLSVLNKKSELSRISVFYAELYVRKYAFLNREKIKRNRELKKTVTETLNLLIENGSVNAYLLREDLL